MSTQDFHKRHTEPSTSGPRPDSGSTPLEIPKNIGPYKIESLLERGGMSILYLGTHPETHEPTTIKVLSPKFLSNEEVVERFLGEATIIAMADHPNIVKLYGHGEWEGGLYIAMEFIQGISLRQYLLQSPISLKRALEIVIDIAYALCHLHTHGVIHRDLKPENVLITEAGEVKVIDFGISQVLKVHVGDLTHYKQRLVGTPIYMSPEQKNNPEEVSYPSDIYSLGIIAYELILGRLSHGQIHLSLMPKGFQKILKKMLQPEPSERYQDIVDFITAVTTYLNSPEIQKEHKIGDKLSELSENLSTARLLLVKENTPDWPGFSLGLSLSRGLLLYGLFYDFFMSEGNIPSIIMGESSGNGAEGLIHTAMIRGMFKTLAHSSLSPLEQLKKLNQLIIEENDEHVFTLSYLYFPPDSEEASFLSCGYGPIWRIPSGSSEPEKMETQDPALGVSTAYACREVRIPWKKGDTLLFCTYASYGNSAESSLNEEQFRLLIAENAGYPPQKLCESIMRRLRMSSSRLLQERSFALIAFRHE